MGSNDIKPVLRLTKDAASEFSAKLTLTTEDGEKDLGVIPFSSATFRLGEASHLPGGHLTLEIPGALVRAEIEELVRDCRVEVIRRGNETE
jgi:hypothetical protein